MSLLSGHRPKVDVAAVRAALAVVEDPELRLPLEEAGMLGGIEAGRDGSVRVTVRLTTPSCPLKDTLARDVTGAVGAVAGVRRVDVAFAAMSEPDRMALASRLRGGRGPGHPFGPGSTTAVYAVASGKGGVGKSTVTANLPWRSPSRASGSRCSTRTCGDTRCRTCSAYAGPRWPSRD